MIEENEARVSLSTLLAAKDGPLSAAWAAFYRKGDTAPYGTARAYGISAIKKELIYNGFGKAIVPELNTFGDAAFKRTIEFQKSLSLTADGVVGPVTAKALFQKRIAEQEYKYKIANQIICKQLALESGFDPAATGTVDFRDRGLAQINSYWHPDIEDKEAFDPAFSIPWTSASMASNISETKDVEAGIAAHNVGLFYAKKWLEAGKPANGLWTIGGKDYAVICTKYVGLILSKTC